MQNLAMTKWLILLHCERFFRISWQSIILSTFDPAMESLKYATLWIASSFTAFIPRNDTMEYEMPTTLSLREKR